jgi:hypothetical protein
MVAMATLLRLTVNPATREQFLELDKRVERCLMQSGGPPSGLMTNIVHPEGDGFVVASVWRVDADAETYLHDVLDPLLAELGLTVAQTVKCPVWSFARP